MFAASTDPTMGIFTGVHFRKEEGDEYLDIVATDTHRLALFRLEGENFPMMNLTLPTSALKVLLPLIDKTATVNWRISEDNTLVEFSDEQWRMLITGLAGTYANYRRVIPQQFIHQVKFRVEEILPALRRMTVFRPSGRRQPLRVILRLVPDSSSMEIVAIDIEMGSYEEVGKETVGVEWLSGSPQPYTIAFQHPYLMEFLSTLRTGEVKPVTKERHSLPATAICPTSSTSAAIVHSSHKVKLVDAMRRVLSSRASSKMWDRIGRVVLAPVVAAAKNRAACSKAPPATVHFITHLTPPFGFLLPLSRHKGKTYSPRNPIAVTR
jgi:DNA polymerase III sliding clamp (beta) subunit (PCNA family)